MAVLLLGLIGAADDIRNLPVLPRLGGQMLAVAIAVAALRLAGGPVLPLPLAIELVALVVAGAWFVNLTNFMDGIDGITLAGFMPLAVGACLIASQAGGGPAAALAPVFLGALAGFLWFNLPKASSSWAMSGACRSGSSAARCCSISPSMAPSPRL